MYPLLAHDYPELAPSLIPRSRLERVLGAGSLADVWQGLTGCTDELAAFRRALKQHPRLLHSVVCDKLRYTTNRVPKNEVWLSAVPLIDNTYQHLISIAFHPSSPIAAVIYKKTGTGRNEYQMLVHAFGGEVREKRGSILYQTECFLGVQICSRETFFWYGEETRSKLSWSPNGEHLLMLSLAARREWEVYLFKWCEAEGEIRRVLTHRLLPYSSKFFDQMFINCWSGPSSFHIVTQNGSNKLAEFYRVDVSQSGRESEVLLTTTTLKKGFPNLRPKTKATAVWFLQGGSGMFVWAEKCQRERHKRHSVVRFRRLDEEEEDRDRRYFILNRGVVVGGEVDSADREAVLLLVAQPFNHLRPIEPEAEENDDHKFKLDWSEASEGGLSKKENSLECGKENVDENDDDGDYFLTDGKARYVLFIVRVWAGRPEQPVVVNVLKKFTCEDERYLVNNTRVSATIMSQSRTSLLLSLWKTSSVTVVASKLLPVSFAVKDLPQNYHWHPTENVYVSKMLVHQRLNFETFHELEDDEDLDDLLSPAEMFVRQPLYVMLKSDKNDNGYERGLKWENCQPETDRCRRNQHECRTCKALGNKRRASEWSNPLPSKVSKQHE